MNGGGGVQGYYAAQCLNTKLCYERKQLERTRDQLLGRWRMHDPAICRHPRQLSTSSQFTAGPSVRSEAAVFDLISTSPLSASSPVASGSAAVDEPGSGRPSSILEADDTDDSDDSEEYSDFFDESVMAALGDIMDDPLSRSLGGASVPSSADTSINFDDVDVRSFVFDDPTRSSSGTAAVDPERRAFPPDPRRSLQSLTLAGNLSGSPVTRVAPDTETITSRAAPAAAATAIVDPERQALPPDPRRSPESKSSRFPATSVAPDTETRTCSGIFSGTGFRIATPPRRTSPPCMTQSPLVGNIPLHLRALSADDDDVD